MGTIRSDEPGLKPIDDQLLFEDFDAEWDKAWADNLRLTYGIKIPMETNDE